MSNFCEYVGGICLVAPLADLGYIKGLSIFQTDHHNLVTAEYLDVVPMRPGPGLISLSLTLLYSATLSVYMDIHAYVFFNKRAALEPD